MSSRCARAFVSTPSSRIVDCTASTDSEFALLHGRVPFCFVLFCFVSFRFVSQLLEGHTTRESYTSPLPYTYIGEEDLPDSFTWGNVDGISYLTHSLNQHIPQYCGSCWAHGALSALGDRIKIVNASKDEINLSVQYLLNCGGHVAGRYACANGRFWLRCAPCVMVMQTLTSHSLPSSCRCGGAAAFDQSTVAFGFVGGG